MDAGRAKLAMGVCPSLFSGDGSVVPDVDTPPSPVDIHVAELLTGVVSTAILFQTMSAAVRIQFLKRLNLSIVEFLAALLCINYGIEAVCRFLEPSIAAVHTAVEKRELADEEERVKAAAIAHAKATLPGAALDVGDAIDPELMRNKINDETSPTARPAPNRERIHGAIADVRDPNDISDVDILRIFGSVGGAENLVFSRDFRFGAGSDSEIEIRGPNGTVSILLREHYDDNDGGVRFLRSILYAIYRVNGGNINEVENALITLLGGYHGQIIFPYVAEVINDAVEATGANIRNVLPQGCGASQKIILTPQWISVEHVFPQLTRTMFEFNYGERSGVGVHCVDFGFCAETENLHVSYRASYPHGTQRGGRITIDSASVSVGRITFHAAPLEE
ncbi:MAG: hypothetical protein LBB38_00305 [Puniceicoccales bacterium]|jgi:hypothetical protein|nr:hypothetical protein [Puniceicoccales bacterium]